LRKAGINANRATTDVIDSAHDAIGKQFDALASNNSMMFDKKLYKDLITALDDYDIVPPSLKSALPQSIAADLSKAVQTAKAQNGVPFLTGQQYQTTRSKIEKAARSFRNDPYLSDTLRNIKNAMDGAMERSIAIQNPSDLGAWRKVRKQYKNLLVVDKAAESSADGLLSPAKIRTAALVQNRRGYVRGKNDFSDLTHAAETLMKPLPQSGTAPRTAARNIVSALPTVVGAGLGASSGYGSNGIEGGLAGAIMGAAMPTLIGRSLLSKPMQKYLTNQILPRRPLTDLRTMLPLIRNVTMPLSAPIGGE